MVKVYAFLDKNDDEIIHIHRKFGRGSKYVCSMHVDDFYFLFDEINECAFFIQTTRIEVEDE